MKYRVGPTPTWFAGEDRSDRFPPGTVVEVTDPTPNAIGDVWAHLVDSVGEALPYAGGQIALSCLEPIEDDEVPRDDARDECDAPSTTPARTAAHRGRTMKYRVGPNPTWSDGADQSKKFPPGTVVTVTTPIPDRDGDVYARRVGPNGDPVPWSGGHIALSCLEPIFEDYKVPDALPFGRASLEAALVAVGHGDLAPKVVRIAGDIEAAR